MVLLGAAPVAEAVHAGKPGGEPCAKQEAQVAKALAKKQHTKKDKKAQLQRVAKAEARLADCEAGHSAGSA